MLKLFVYWLSMDYNIPVLVDQSVNILGVESFGLKLFFWQSIFHFFLIQIQIVYCISCQVFTISKYWVL